MLARHCPAEITAKIVLTCVMRMRVTLSDQHPGFFNHCAIAANSVVATVVVICAEKVVDAVANVQLLLRLS